MAAKKKTLTAAQKVSALEKRIDELEERLVILIDPDQLSEKLEELLLDTVKAVEEESQALLKSMGDMAKSLKVGKAPQSADDAFLASLPDHLRCDHHILCEGESEEKRAAYRKRIAKLVKPLAIEVDGLSYHRGADEATGRPAIHQLRLFRAA